MHLGSLNLIIAARTATFVRDFALVKVSEDGPMPLLAQSCTLTRRFTALYQNDLYSNKIKASAYLNFTTFECLLLTDCCYLVLNTRLLSEKV